MADFLSKQHASYPEKYQVLQYASATCWSTSFTNGIGHIRVVAQLAGWGTVCQTTADSIIATSAGGVGMAISASQTGEYFTVRPGQIFVFSSTSTSTGACTVTEMS